MYLTEAEARNRMVRCTKVEVSRVGFAGCEETAELEAYICDDEVLFAKATNLSDETDFAYLDDPHDLVGWLRSRFPTGPEVN